MAWLMLFACAHQHQFRISAYVKRLIRGGRGDWRERRSERGRRDRCECRFKRGRRDGCERRFKRGRRDGCECRFKRGRRDGCECRFKRGRRDGCERRFKSGLDRANVSVGYGRRGWRGRLGRNISPASYAHKPECQQRKPHNLLGQSPPAFLYVNSNLCAGYFAVITADLIILVPTHDVGYANGQCVLACRSGVIRRHLDRVDAGFQTLRYP